tara:strand:- start:90 stop:467 length:378 start_codon:yes stop_codon:yes gene_type:complete
MEKISSNRSFGIIFSIVFILIAIWPLPQDGSLRVWAVPISVIFVVLGLLNSKLLTPLNLIWVKFGELLGRIVAPIVMAFVYFMIVTPVGLFMRLIGKDFLNIKYSKQNSYWIKREKNIESMKRQF